MAEENYEWLLEQYKVALDVSNIVRFGRLVPSRFRSGEERIVESNVESAIVGKTVVGAVMPNAKRHPANINRQTKNRN